MKPQQPVTVGRIFLSLTRVWLPVIIAVIGIVMIVLGHASLSDQSTTRTLEAGAGVGLVIVAIIVWMVNWMFRMSIQSSRDREIEEEAREYFDRHGHWPDEDPR